MSKREMKAAFIGIYMDETGKFKTSTMFNGPFEAYNGDLVKFIKECAPVLEKQLNEQPGKWPGKLILPGMEKGWFQ